MPAVDRIQSSNALLSSTKMRRLEGRRQANIVDIRRAAVETSLKADILVMFRPRNGLRRLPTMLLYDEKGLQLFEEITYLEEYYLTNAEMDLFKTSAAEMADAIPSGAMLVELGSGNLRKVGLLLQALDDAQKMVDYYALDLSRRELERTLAQLPVYDFIRPHGLLGTYEDGREWLQSPLYMSRHKCIMSLGSSIGNFSRHEAADFLRTFANVLQRRDTIMVGLDGCRDAERIYHAYNDDKGLTHHFVLNGLAHANRVLGGQEFKQGDWRVIGEYVLDDDGGRHQAFYAPRQDTLVLGETIRAHERIQAEQSYKYSADEADELWATAGLVETRRWTNSKQYGIHLLSLAKTTCSPDPPVLPTVDEWEALWAVWDVVTRQMLPHDELLSRPIKLRNACVFYLGHIPTFLDLQLTKTTGHAPTEPATYAAIFERGIDPDVDNPGLCHAHSAIPDEWPPVHQILAYQQAVRNRLRRLYGDKMLRSVQRAVWVGFEHELMHIETLLYMMLQSNKPLPPPHLPRPDFAGLAAVARARRVPNQWFDVPPQRIVVGLDDPEDETDARAAFGWDNEKPRREVDVHALQAQGRPLTNHEYAQYLYHAHVDVLPASWAVVDAHSHDANYFSDPVDVPASFLRNKAVRSVYGLVPLHYALDWPVFGSYDELAGCAAWMGGRIPTFDEARSIYAHAHTLKKETAERTLTRSVPAVNGHLSNNGVHQTPPAVPPLAERDPDSLYVDLDGANVGFQHWHPVSITANGDRLAGQAEMGGVWEWTSSVLQPHAGFQPMPLYPGYTADFFDGKHNVVLGGSWATHPRIAGRRSFVNWYQRNYPYAWVGARLVRDTT